MSVIQAIIIAIVEGITEFLPISSTGHMALTSAMLGIETDKFTKLFIENIQFGTIISVIILYWRKFLNFKKLSFYVKLFIAFLPAAIVGILLKKHIDRVLKPRCLLLLYYSWAVFYFCLLTTGSTSPPSSGKRIFLIRTPLDRDFSVAVDHLSRFQPQRCHHHRGDAAETDPENRG